MPKYSKQLTQKCSNPNCSRAFCRNVSDNATINKISRILSKYGDLLLCRKIQKLDVKITKLNKNIIIDSLFYINSLICQEEQEWHPVNPSIFNLNDTKLFKKIDNGETVSQNQTPNKENESCGMEPIKPCKNLNHRFCTILSQAYNSTDLYLLTGVLHVFLGKFKVRPDFNLAMIITRIYNVISKYEDIDSSLYKTLVSVFSIITEKILTSMMIPFLKITEGCINERCLFTFDLSKNDLIENVITIRNQIEGTFPVDFRENSRLSSLFEILKQLFLINEKFSIVDESEFVIKKFFSTINLKNELKFSKLKFQSPLEYSFAIPINTKAEILKIYNGEGMKASLQDSFFKALFQGVTQPYLFINIRRDKIYTDTLKIIMEVDNIDVKKQLKVKFLGEEGIDSGGIKKEYFLLIGREIENDLVLFAQTNNRIWFRKGVDLKLLNAIGKIIGIAMYNDVVLSVPFPSLLFKKLLNISLNFEDLEEIEPEIYNSLKNLEKCSTEDLQFLDQNFTADVEVLGRRINYELTDGGENLKVNKNNVSEFVELYWKFLMEKVIEAEFRAFSEGFYSIIKLENIKVFKPCELEKILIGVDDFDFDLIKKSTVYTGFTPEDQIVKFFWEFFYEMRVPKRKKLIQFITGNDRLPIGGSTTLNLVIMKNGCDTDRLPSSQTCFNTLLLPEYSSKEKMKEKLGKAIDLTAGFFLM